MELMSQKWKSRIQKKEYHVSHTHSLIILFFLNTTCLFFSERNRDIKIARDNEYSDSEDEGDNRKDGRSYKEAAPKKKPRLTKDDLGKRHTPSPAPSSNLSDETKTAKADSVEPLQQPSTTITNNENTSEEQPPQDVTNNSKNDEEMDTQSSKDGLVYVKVV